MLRLTLLAALAAITTGCDNSTIQKSDDLIKAEAFFRHTWPWNDFGAYMAVTGFCLTMFAIYGATRKNDSSRDVYALIVSLILSTTVVWVGHCAGAPEINWLGTIMLIPAGFAIWWQALKARRQIGSTSFMQSILNRRRETKSRQREPTDTPTEMACPHCGTTNPQGYTFCSFCGKRPQQQQPPLTDSATRDEPDQPAQSTSIEEDDEWGI